MSDEIVDREHPAAEKLSAYQANELSPEENDRIQEHVASCDLCAERLLDLQRFLEFAPDPSREGVPDLETTKEWRKLNKRIKRERPSQFYRWPAVAAVLALGLAWALYQLVTLERELAKPVTDLEVVTLEALGSHKGEPSAEPRSLKLAGVIALDTHSGYPRYRLNFLDENGGIRKSVEDTEDEHGMITLFLPRRFLPPGLYHIQAVGLAGPTPHLVGSFEVRITR